MAYLKAGSTVNGELILTSSQIPFTPVGDSVHYKDFKLYSEHDKPQAKDNDFVSKSQGGSFLAPVNIKDSMSINGSDSGRLEILSSNSNFRLSIGGNLYFQVKRKTDTDYKSIITYSSDDKVTIDSSQFNATKIYDTGQRVYSGSNPPTPSNVGLGNVINARQVKLSGDTMTGDLSAPNFSSTNPGKNPDHLVRLDQVVVKGSTIDFGTF